MFLSSLKNSKEAIIRSFADVDYITRQHRHDMAEIIKNLLAPSSGRSSKASWLALAIDAAIVYAKFSETSAAALKNLSYLFNMLFAGQSV